MPLRANQHCEIILLDDDEDDFIFLKNAFLAYSDQIVLHHLKGSSDIFTSLQNALTLPSLIMLDMHMGGIEAMDVLTRLKQDTHLRDIPVVIWSGLLTDQQVNRCYEAGASSVIFKSDDQSNLERVISQVCAYWLEAVQLPFYPKQSTC